MKKDVNKKSIRGQIAIFLALIFVVLFTMFGLTLNVSMVVHDKINLQNSADFASYYIAQRQAEMLNAIAHTNYQMRQSWKLFAFRYRVIGSIGRKGVLGSPTATIHPGIATAVSGYRLSENDFWGATSNGICAAAPYFFAPLAQGDYLCRMRTVTVPKITAGSVSLPGLGGAGFVTGSIGAVNATIDRACETQSYFNWWYALTIFEAFQQDQASRKAIIRSLVENLSRPIIAGSGGMKDLDGNSVYEGAFNTFQFNLSESNKESDRNYNLKFFNSLEGVTREQWIPEITIDALVPYVRFSGSGGACSTDPFTRIANIDSPDSVISSGLVAQMRGQLDPSDLILDNKGYSFDKSELRTLALGVEKNPWYAVYNKVVAAVYSKALFSPSTVDTGPDGQKGIRLTATSYSKPFGGRIGPWYMSRWPSGSSESSGGDKSDLVGPPRSTGSLVGLTATDPLLQPNHSRYPGDQKGLITESAMVSIGRLIDWGVTSPQSTIRGDDLTFSAYSFFSSNIDSDPLAQRNQSLPGNTVAAQDAFLRKLEIAAVAPDAFDIAYYSIFPGFWDNFGSKLSTWIQPEGGNASYKIRADLGSMPSAGNAGGVNYASYDIINQLEQSEKIQLITGVGTERDRRVAPWFVKRRNGGSVSPSAYSYLSGWNSGLDVMEYITPSALGNRFAKCENDGDLSTSGSALVKIPGECIKGGRVGYSVKFISQDYLDSTDHPIGGNGATGGFINNSL